MQCQDSLWVLAKGIDWTNIEQKFILLFKLLRRNWLIKFAKPSQEQNHEGMTAVCFSLEILTIPLFCGSFKYMIIIDVPIEKATLLLYNINILPLRVTKIKVNKQSKNDSNQLHGPLVEFLSSTM